MDIKTKFNIGDLLECNHNEYKDGFVVQEVMEIIAQVCYGGTQVFYDTRLIYISKKYGNWQKERGCSSTKSNSPCGFFRYREDELVKISEEAAIHFKDEPIDNTDCKLD